MTIGSASGVETDDMAVMTGRKRQGEIENARGVGFALKNGKNGLVAHVSLLGAAMQGRLYS